MTESFPHMTVLVIIIECSVCTYVDASWRDTQRKHCIYCHDSLKLSGSILDLIITNEEHRINEVLYQPILRLSDHVCLQFKYFCYVKKCIDQPQDLICTKLTS